MLVPNDRRNDAVQDLLPDALNGTDRAADDRPLPSSNDGFRPELPFLTSCLNGLGWSRAAARLGGALDAEPADRKAISCPTSNICSRLDVTFGFASGRVGLTGVCRSTLVSKGG